MKYRRRLVAALALALALSSGAAGAEVVQKGKLRVSFEGELAPISLPRSGTRPVRVTMGGTITAIAHSAVPQLRRVSIAVNRYGRFAPGALPSCRIEQIQPATTQAAEEACGNAIVGHGSFSAKVLLPEQAPFPSDGEVVAFNGRVDGHPAILAHVYGTEPIPTSYTLPFLIGDGKGRFGTVLSASLPQITSEWGYVTGFRMTLDQTSGHGYVSAGCPAPRGFSSAVFPLVRTTFSFEGGARLGTTLVRRCRVAGR